MIRKYDDHIDNQTKGDAPFALENVHVVPVLRLAGDEAKAGPGVELSHRAPDGRPLRASWRGVMEVSLPACIVLFFI